MSYANPAILPNKNLAFKQFLSQIEYFFNIFK